MSKIGKKNIEIPKDVKAAIAGNILNLEGPKGKRSIELKNDVLDVKIDNSKILVRPKNKNNLNSVLWGLQRSLINNAIIGIFKGYEKTLKLTGVGFRANLKGKQLNLQLGFSHDINYDIPEGITIKVEKQTIIKISGTDKQQVGMVAAEIKSIRPPEPYKGKGIKEQGQYILRKEGKKK